MTLELAQVIIAVIALFQVAGLAVIGYLIGQISYLTKRVDGLSRDLNRVLGKLGVETSES